MSKKLLKESTIRRFGGLAGIKPATTSNFLGEMSDEPVYVREEEEELEVVDDLELELPPEEVEIEDEEEIVVEPEVGGEEALVMSLLDKVKEWAAEKGVEMEVAGEAEVDLDLDDLDVDLDADLDLDLDAEEDAEAALDIEGEEGLEEMIGSILAEKDEEDLTEEKEEVIEEEEELEEKKRTDKTIDEPTGPASDKGEENKRGTTSYYQEGRIQVVDDEKVIQEVTRRVKQRLARIAKSRKK